MSFTGSVVLAPDKFKGSLTAAEVARHLAAGLRRFRPGSAASSGWRSRQVPIADGGDGTLEELAASVIASAWLGSGAGRDPNLEQ